MKKIIFVGLGSNVVRLEKVSCIIKSILIFFLFVLTFGPNKISVVRIRIFSV